MEELVRKCFLLSLRPSYARGNHIIVHGGQPCFWPSTRRMQFKQGLWNVKRLLLRMMHRREVFPWEFRITPLLDLQFLLLIWTFKESQFSFPLCLKHLLSTRFLLSYLANRSHTTYTPLPSKTWLLPPPQPPTQNRLSLNEFHFLPIFAVFSVLSITSYCLISYLERLLRFTFVFAQVLKWSAHLGYVHCIHFTSEAHAIWICMWYVHSRYLLLVTPYQNLHQGRCSVIPCESGMWIKSLLYLFNIQKHVPLSVPGKDTARFLGGLVPHGEVGSLTTHICVSVFLQEDEVVLQCIANIHKEQRKFCLAAEGLGNRLCFLEPTSEAKVRWITCPAPFSWASQAVT